MQVGAQVFVVGVGEGGFTKLGELPAADLPADEPAPTGAFGDVLSRVLSRAESRSRSRSHKKESP